MRYFFFRYELQHFLQHFGVKVSIIEAGFFRNGMVDAQAFSKTIKQVWDEVPMHIKETYGQKLFDESPSQVDILLAPRCLDDTLGSLGAKGTSEPRGFGSRLVFGGRRRGLENSPQSTNR